MPKDDRRSRRFYLVARIDRPPDRHPTFVCFLALYARDVNTGELPGEPWHYQPALGERYAREALIATREFTTLAHRSDREIAAHFRVPIEQIASRRRDLAIWSLRNIVRLRRRGYRRNRPPTSRRRAGC